MSELPKLQGTDLVEGRLYFLCKRFMNGDLAFFEYKQKLVDALDRDSQAANRAVDIIARLITHDYETRNLGVTDDDGGREQVDGTNAGRDGGTKE